MALAANTIIKQSSTAAFAPTAKARDNTSTDQNSSFEDVLAQQDASSTGNNAQVPAQGADNAKTSKGAQKDISKGSQKDIKLGNVSGDQAANETIATADVSQDIKARPGKPADKVKTSTSDDKNSSDPVNDNELGNSGDPTQQIAPVPPPATPSTPQPSSAAASFSLEAIGEAASGSTPATTRTNNTNNSAASGSTDEAPAVDEGQAADAAPTAGNALSSNAFQKMLGAAKATAARDGQASKASSDKDIKAPDANVAGTNSGTENPIAVKPAAPANTAMPGTISTATPTDKTASAGSNATPVATTQNPAAPNLNSLAVEITAKAQSGAKQFDIRLDPPELGRIEVRLSIDATGKAQAHLSADQPQTLELLQKDAPALTQALRDAGLDVNQSGLNFSLKNQQQNTGGNNSSGQNYYDGTANSSANAVIETSNSGSSYTSGAGLLDIMI